MKMDILRDAHYTYNFDHELYFNREAKKAFSFRSSTITANRSWSAASESAAREVGGSSTSIFRRRRRRSANWKGSCSGRAVPEFPWSCDFCESGIFLRKMPLDIEVSGYSNSGTAVAMYPYASRPASKPQERKTNV